MEAFLDIEVWRAIQNDFTRAMGMELVTVGQDGSALTDDSGYRGFCSRVHPCHGHNCEYEEHSFQKWDERLPKKRHVYLCHAGVVCCSVPMVCDGVYHGTVLGKMEGWNKDVQQVEAAVNVLQQLTAAAFRRFEAAAPQSGQTSAPDETVSFRDNMLHKLREHCFKDCWQSLRSYVDEIYDQETNYEVISHRMSGLLQDIASLAGEPSPERELSKEQGAGAGMRFDEPYGNRYYGYMAAEQKLKAVFEQIDQTYVYSDTMEKAINYVDENIRGNITLQDAASVAQVNVQYFCKLFKRKTSMNFIAYLTARKIEIAKEMLKYTKMPVTNIAYALSYIETSYFCKVFKKAAGMTPIEFRNSCAEH